MKIRDNPKKTLVTVFGFVVVIVYICIFVMNPYDGTEPGDPFQEQRGNRPEHDFTGTVVTAYFRFKSKHSADEYDAWMRNMLSLQDPMVIYTTDNMVANITKMRGHAEGLTLIIPTNLSDTMMATEYSHEFWQNQMEIDPHGHIMRYWELYVVYAEKANFLKRALEMNPFKTSFFAWVDIGSFRGDKYNGETMLSVIPPDLREDQVLLTNITAFAMYPDQGVCGCFFGGFAKGVLRWHQKFYAVLKDGADQGKFIGLDQPWMKKTCDAHQGLCKTVHPFWRGRPYWNSWFYMAPYLMGYTPQNGKNQTIKFDEVTGRWMELRNGEWADLKKHL